MKFNTTYFLQKIIACNMPFVNDNQQNLLWQHIALKIIIVMIVTSPKQCGHHLIVRTIRIFGKRSKTCIESHRLLYSIHESKTKKAKEAL